MVRELDRFLKEIEKGNKVFDFWKIDAENFPINIIISERGQKGKTFGLKDFMFSRFMNNQSGRNTECLFLRSLSKDSEAEATRFLNDMPPRMRAEEEYLKAEKDKITYKDKPVFVFKPVSTTNSLRGTRTIFNHIVWDEFNDSIRFFKKDLVDNIANLLSSADNPNERGDEGENPRKFWLLGNNRGLNHPLLIQLGIDHIDGEITRIYDDNGNPLVLLICPIYTKEDIAEIEESKKKDWLFQFNKRVGTADHIYFNQSDVDSINYVHRYFELDNKDMVGEALKIVLDPNYHDNHLRLKYTFMIEGNLLNFYHIPPPLIDKNLNTRWHVVNVDLMTNFLKRKGQEIRREDVISRNNEGEYLIYTTNKLELTEGIHVMPNEFKNALINHNGNCNISFENTTSRINFMNLITK